MIIAIAGSIVVFLLIVAYISRALRGWPSDEVVSSLERKVTFFIILGIFMFGGKFFLEREEEKNLQQSIRSHVESAVNAQKIYYYKNQRYAVKKEELGTILPETMELFLSQEDLPIHYKNALSEEDQPFVSKDNFQIFAVLLRRAGKPPEFFIQPKNGPLRGLPQGVDND